MPEMRAVAEANKNTISVPSHRDKVLVMPQDIFSGARNIREHDRHDSSPWN